MKHLPHTCINPQLIGRACVRADNWDMHLTSDQHTMMVKIHFDTDPGLLIRSLRLQWLDQSIYLFLTLMTCKEVMNESKNQDGLSEVPPRTSEPEHLLFSLSNTLLQNLP